MIQRIFMIILILTIVLGGGFYAYKELIPPQQETQATVYATKEVVRGDITVGVEVIGRLEPSNQGGLRVGGDFRGRGSGTSFQSIIDEYLVEEGQEVKQGQVVARLVSKDLETKIEEKQDELKRKMEQVSEMSRVPVEEVESLNPSKGITIRAPIEGIVTNLEVTEGKKIDLGSTIARVVDSSRYRVEARLYEQEVKMVEEGQKVTLTFPYFDTKYEGTIIKVNPNRIPLVQEDGKGFAKGFVYIVTIEAENMGLVQRNMEVRVGVESKNDPSSIHYFANMATVKEFIKEDRIMNTTVEAIVTEIHVDEMQQVKKGDPIITLSGNDIQKILEEKLEEVRRVKSDLRELTSKLEQLEVKAPMDGVVAKFQRPVGETVSEGEWIGYLYTVSDMTMYSQVDDIDVLHVQQGAPVKVTVDALANQSFTGEVEYVSTMGEMINGMSKFHISIKVKGGPDLRPGMQARAYVDAGSADNVLLIPVEAIFEEGGKTMVEVLEGDDVTKVVEVKLGLMNDRVAEVKSGLEEGDKVVTGSSADLLPSQHIKSQGGIMPDKKESDKENQGGDSKTK